MEEMERKMMMFVGKKEFSEEIDRNLKVQSQMKSFMTKQEVNDMMGKLMQRVDHKLSTMAPTRQLETHIKEATKVNEKMENLIKAV
jgi:hypothetical protein